MDVEELQGRIAARVREAAAETDRRFDRIEAAAREGGGRLVLEGFTTSTLLRERLLALLARDGIEAGAEGLSVVGGPGAAMERIAVAGVVDIRAEASHRSEMLTQCVLGESLDVLLDRGSWTLVRAADGYLGWAARSGLAEPGRDYLALREKGAILRVTALRAVLRETSAAGGPPVRHAPFDSRLLLSDREGAWRRVLLADGASGWIAAEDVSDESEMPRYPSARRTVEEALAMVGVPYLWGGTTPLGFDCSGLVQRVYGHCGVLLPRDADLQKRALEEDWVGSDAEEGDLLFFGGERPEHVAISLGGKEFLHASGWVKIESLDERSPLYRGDLAAVFLGAGRIALLGRR